MLTKEELSIELMKICQSKADELILLGCEDVNAHDVWNYVLSKKQEEINSLHQFVNAALSLKLSSFLSWKEEKCS